MSQLCPIISPKLIPTIGAILRSLSYSPIHFVREMFIRGVTLSAQQQQPATCEDDDEDDDQQVAELSEEPARSA